MMQAAIEIIMALLIFFRGFTTSEPLLVIVVKPLNARTPSAVAAMKAFQLPGTAETDLVPISA